MNGRRAALVVGVDDYDHFFHLHGCVNDANAVYALLACNDDQSLNFESRLLSSRKVVSAPAIRASLEELFRNKDINAAVFFFAGHGTILSGNQGHLCTADGSNSLPGIALNHVLGLANASPAPNKFIILDCCHAGSIRDLVVVGGNAPPLALDPSFEYTDPSAKNENVEVFRILQQMRATRLVVPVNFEHMYDAAMERGACQLTPLGQFYWRQAKDGRI
jgi:uncharacterized caspase-like protein